jgi:hypothetical protein
MQCRMWKRRGAKRSDSAGRADDNRGMPRWGHGTGRQRAAAPQGGHAFTERTPDLATGRLPPGAPVPLLPQTPTLTAKQGCFVTRHRNAGLFRRFPSQHKTQRRDAAFRHFRHPALEHCHDRNCSRHPGECRRSSFVSRVPRASWIPASAGMTPKELIPAFTAAITLHPPRPLRGAIMRRREAGPGAVSLRAADAQRRSGRRRAPPGSTKRPCQELADDRRVYPKRRRSRSLDSARARRD